MPSCLPPRSLPLRRALLVLLALGLLLQAQAGMLRQLLGAAHWHQPVAVQHGVPGQVAGAAGWLARLQQWRQQLQARSPLVGGHAVAGHGPWADHDDSDGHHHTGLARHHHAPLDASVVTLEPATNGADPLADNLAGSLLQPLALATPAAWPAPAASGQAWARAAQDRWHDAALRRPERPPQA